MSIDISRVRVLCFDVDGTLRDTDDQLVLRLAELLHPLRFLFPHRDPRPFSRRIIMGLENPGNFLHGLLDRLNIDHHLARATDLLYWLGIGKDSGQFLIIEGVHEMLDYLQHQYPLAVITARGRRGTYAFLDHYQITPFFQHIATAQTCQHTKPYPDQILWVADRTGVPPSACLMIGDTTVDIRSGKAAGAQTVGVLCGFGDEDELRRSGADLILPSTSDLINLFLDAENASDNQNN